MALTVGVPKETKTAEHRVALTPDGVRELERHGVEVFVEAGAGVDSAVPDADFDARRAPPSSPPRPTRGPSRWSSRSRSPRATSSAYLRPDLTLFTYLHLAAYPDVAKALLSAGTTGIAYETVREGRRLAAAPGPDVRGGRPPGPADGRPSSWSATTAAAAC